MSKRGARGGQNKRQAATPLTMEEVADMLRRATEAVTSRNPMTAEAVYAMSEEDLRSDLLLGAAFQRGWNTCRATIHQALQSPSGPAKRQRMERSYATTARTPGAPHATKPPVSCQKPAATTPLVAKVPPPPSNWAPAERIRALSFDPHGGHHPPGFGSRGRPSTSRGAVSRLPDSRPCGASGNRETAPNTPKTKSERGRNRKYERYLRFKEKERKEKESRRTEASQQYRLAKHPETPSTTNSGAEPMDTDDGGPGTTATLETPRNAVELMSEDDETAFLNSSLPSLSPQPELDDEDPPFFQETPIASPTKEEN